MNVYVCMYNWQFIDQYYIPSQGATLLAGTKSSQQSCGRPVAVGTESNQNLLE